MGVATSLRRQHKTPQWIADWQARMYIYSCYLYDSDYEHPLDDMGYTTVWQMLAGRAPYPGPPMWNDLSPELKERIPFEILDTPSSIGLRRLGWRQEDHTGAFEWFQRVEGRLPEKLTTI